MLILESQHVYMHQQAENKDAALALCSHILQQDGLATAEYLTGLKNREGQSSTYLGQGIAIPHGTPESRHYILQTGVRLVHFPQGVIWTDTGDKVYLAVVIAAQSDEHLQVLQLLTQSLGSDDLTSALQQVQSAEEVLALLNATPPSLLLHERLIKTQVEAGDIDDVLVVANQVLKQAECVQAGFMSAVNIAEAVQLQDHVWCVTGRENVLQSAVSIIHLNQVIDFNIKNTKQKLKTLLCVSCNDQFDYAKFNQLMNVLFAINTQDWQQPLHIAQVIGAESLPQWASQSVILANAHGLHARPATMLAKFCQQLQGEILLMVDNGQAVSAKSLTKLLSLGAVRGQTLTFMADEQAEQHLDSIVKLVQQGLGEEVEPVIPVVNDDISVEHQECSNCELLQLNQPYQAIAASQGIAVGVVHIVQQMDFNYHQQGRGVADEQMQLAQAIAQVEQDLQQLVVKNEPSAIAEIFKAHIEILQDKEIYPPVDAMIKQGFSAAYAWHQQIEHLVQTQRRLNNALLAERADDLQDIGRRVLAVLCGKSLVQEPEQPYILIKDDLLPSDVAQLDQEKVLGILTAVGGASSHSAIVARALGIPAVVGAGTAILDIPVESTVLLDGERGEFVVQPDVQRVDEAFATQQRQKVQREQALQRCHEAAITQDQHQVEIATNLGDVHHAQNAVSLGAEAVGLLRTELVFMSHQSAPSLAQQEQDYRVVFDALAGRPLVVRTLDIGGDKPLPYIAMPKEENPFLGVRGMRLTLRQPALLRTQLQALINAADGRPLRIMFPMIGRIEEWRAAKAILDDILSKTPCENLQVGMMIEVPSAVLLAPILAQEVDFFSIGTNDLTQYVMAIDRGHPELSSEADGLHPSVLMMINHTVKFAHRYGKWVGVCGELASDRLAVPILLGLGVDELSMSPNQIPLVKAQVRQLNWQDCQVMAKQSLTCATADEVRQLSAQFLEEQSHG